MPSLALQSGRKAKFIFIFAIVAFVQGAFFSGGADVDVNVFFDFAISISVGLGLIEHEVFERIEQKSASDGHRMQYVLAAWLVVTAAPLVLSFETGAEQANVVVAAVTANTQGDDLDYIRSAAGAVACKNLALCYWAGKPFAVVSSLSVAGLLLLLSMESWRVRRRHTVPPAVANRAE